jgi:hypothetical protein
MLTVYQRVKKLYCKVITFPMLFVYPLITRQLTRTQAIQYDLVSTLRVCHTCSGCTIGLRYVLNAGVLLYPWSGTQYVVARY